MTDADREAQRWAANSPDVQVDGHPAIEAVEVDEWRGHLERVQAGPSEFQMQEAIFETAAFRGNQDPDWGMLYAIPNGMYKGKGRVEAGVRPGFPDMGLPVARGCYYGAFIELKVGDNKPTPEQVGWLNELQARGYFVAVCYGHDETIETLEWYLGLEVYGGEISQETSGD